MMKKILIGLLVIVAGLIVFVSLRPAELSVARSAKIEAPVGEVFPLVNNLRNWDSWSPWAKLDPDSTATFSGPDSGEGAGFAWSGNGEVGVGSQTIVESKENELIAIKLSFSKPMKMENDVKFTFSPVEGGTEVTWTMSGTNNFVGKAFGLFMDCDKLVGAQFEEGLNNMNQVATAKSTDT